MLGRILVPVVAVVAIASAVTAWVGGRTVGAHLLTMAEQQLGATADGQAVRLAKWSQDVRRDIAFWSSEAVFIKSTNDDFIGRQARKSAGDRLALLHKTYPGFVSLSLVDSTGLVISSSSSSANVVGSLKVGDREAIKEALAGREALSAAFVAQQAVFTIACPVSHGGKVVGAFYADIDVLGFNTGFLATAGNTDDAYSFVFDGSGRLIAHPTPALLVDDAISLTTLPFGAALRANTGGQVRYAFKGVDKLAAVRQVAGTPWLLCRAVELHAITLPVQRLQSTLLLLSGGAVILITIVAWLVSASIARPLRRTATILEAVASGDLSQQPKREGGRELEAMNGALASALIGMRNALGTAHVDWAAIGRQTQLRKELVERLAQASRELGATGARLTTSAETTAGRAATVSIAAEEVARSVQTVSVGTDQMSAAIAEIAGIAGDAAHAAASAVQDSEQASRLVDRLGAGSARIGEVVAVIDGIAAKTRLLALNAAIEAAGAGEAGRGFAVVAGEVKELASQTAGSTSDIQARVADIQRDIAATIEAIRAVTVSIREVGTHQTTIASAVEQQAATTRQMTGSVGAAVQGIRDIAGSIQGVAVAAREASDAAGSTKASADTLAHLAADLRA